MEHALKLLNTGRRHSRFDLGLLLGEDLVNFGKNYLVWNSIASEKTENIRVVLLDAVEAVDEDECSAQSWVVFGQ